MYDVNKNVGLYGLSIGTSYDDLEWCWTTMTPHFILYRSFRRLLR